MDKGIVAEWLLRRVVDPMRASELVGDELEAHPAAGNCSFWMSIAHQLVAFSWRTLLAMALSPIAGLLLAIAAGLLVNIPLDATRLVPAELAFHVSNYLLGVSIVLWIGAAFSLIRFGWRSSFTRVWVGFSVLWSASSSFFAFSTPAIALAILWLVFMGFCMSNARRRRALGILIGAAGLSWLTALVLSVCSHDPHNVFGNWQFYAAVILVPVVQGTFTTTLYREK